MILVTGGAGFIGSHAVVELQQAGYEVVVLDNLCNSSVDVLDRIAAITGQKPNFVRGDVRDGGLLGRIFAEYPIEAVMHFAGLKAVGESVEQPLRYFENNVVGTITLCHAMEDAGLGRLVFSSSATVYGVEHPPPWHEGLRTGTPTNPYGRSKLMIEQILTDLAASDERWQIGVLRYFNPVGAHESGRLGESPRGTPNNLVPYIAQVAIGQRYMLDVFGNDWPTRDGTCVRDYIHVVDLVHGHLRALKAIKSSGGVHVWNLGTGRGHTVLEVVRAFEEVSGRQIPYRISARRPGDMAEFWADPSRAQRDLGWRAQRDLGAMMRDVWNWQRHQSGA